MKKLHIIHHEIDGRIVIWVLIKNLFNQNRNLNWKISII